jgi:hypothetical protein
MVTNPAIAARAIHSGRSEDRDLDHGYYTARMPEYCCCTSTPPNKVRDAMSRFYLGSPAWRNEFFSIAGWATVHPLQLHRIQRLAGC